MSFKKNGIWFQFNQISLNHLDNPSSLGFRECHCCGFRESINNIHFFLLLVEGQWINKGDTVIITWNPKMYEPALSLTNTSSWEGLPKGRVGSGRHIHLSPHCIEGNTKSKGTHPLNLRPWESWTSEYYSGNPQEIIRGTRSQNGYSKSPYTWKQWGWRKGETSLPPHAKLMVKYLFPKPRGHSTYVANECGRREKMK